MADSERVIFVHGTGASAPSDDGEAWWQRSGTLWTELAARGITPEAFIWSGDNSELARRQAGRRLAQRIHVIGAAGEQVHLIGHSHGGSVITHALGLLPDGTRTAILSWITVGTPYLRYGLRLPRLIFDALALLGSCVVLVSALLTLREVDVALAWEHERGFTALWFALLAIPLALALWYGLSLLPYTLQLLQRGSLRRLAAQREAHLALWSRQDEPIIGLGASGSFSLRVLGGGRGTGLVALFRPLAMAVNQFVNNLVSRALQGSNIRYLEMRAAASAPSPELAHQPLPQDIDDELISRANHSAAALGLRVRDILASGRDPVTGFSDLQRSAATAFTFNELVHTTYFQSSGCIDLMLHHILGRSGLAPAPALQERLGAWYSARFDGAVSVPANRLPSNRMGFTLAAGLAVLSLILALSAISLGVLHARVLAPTTAGFHLVDLISSRRLAVALGGIVPVETLDQQFFQPLPLRLDLVQPLAPSTNLSTLKSYLQAIVRGRQLEHLVSNVLQLDAPELRTLFYAYALRLVVETAEHDQVLWLARSKLFPGPGVPRIGNDMRVRPDFNYPGMDIFLEATAARGLLDAEIFAAVTRSCPRESSCMSWARAIAARALARAGKISQLDFLLPLPPTIETVEMVNPQSQVRFPFHEELLPLLPSFVAQDWPYFVWLAGQQAWKHLAAASHLFRSHAMRWSEVDTAVRQGLDRAEGETVNYILEFIVSMNWSDSVPAEVRQHAQLLLDKQVKTSTDPTLPVVGQKRFDGFAAREVAKQQCASLTDLEPDAFESRLAELEQQDLSCRSESKQFERKRQALLSQKNVREADNFDAFLLNFARLRIADMSAGEVSQARQDLFDHLRNAMCDSSHRFYQNWTVRGGRKDLAAALRVLGRPQAGDPDIAAWMQRVASDSPCVKWKSLDNFERGEVVARARAITFEIIDWLDSGQPEEALQHMQRLSFTSAGPVTSRPIGEPDIQELASWFLSRRYAADVLFITNVNAFQFSLIRRAALYRLASCERAHGLRQRADLLAALAARSGQLNRQHVAPGEAMDVIRAEAEYHALHVDWLRAASSCDRCDARDALKVASDLIVPLAYRHLRISAPKPVHCKEMSDQMFDLILTSQQKIEQESAQAAKDRAASTAEKWMRTPTN